MPTPPRQPDSVTVSHQGNGQTVIDESSISHTQTSVATTPSRPSTRTTRVYVSAGTAPYWYDAPSVWDCITIQNEKLPGICKVTGHLGRKLDINSPPGNDGARIRDKGYEPCRFTIEATIWTPEQYQLFLPIYAKLIALGGRTRTALSVSHPTLNAAGVNIAYLERISLLEDGPVKGAKKYTITMVQVQPPRIVHHPIQSTFVQPDAITGAANPGLQPATPAGQGAANPQMGNVRQLRASR